MEYLSFKIHNKYVVNVNKKKTNVEEALEREIERAKNFKTFGGSDCGVYVTIKDLLYNEKTAEIPKALIDGDAEKLEKIYEKIRNG